MRAGLSVKFTRRIAVAAALVAPAMACGAPLPLGLIPGETGRVRDIIDGDSFVLDDGVVVRLASIEAPRLRREDAISQSAKQFLTHAILGQTVRLYYGGLRRDIRGRALAHVRIGNDWLQHALLEGGMARVHTYPDNHAAIEPMWLAERLARRNGLGLWADPRFQVRFATPEALAGDDLSFQLVEGHIRRIDHRQSISFLHFSATDADDVRALVPANAHQRWANGRADLDALRDIGIRLRGYVRLRPVPTIILDHPEQLEYLLDA